MLLAGYLEVSIKYGLGAGSSPCESSHICHDCLHSCVPGHPAKTQRWEQAGPLCTDKYSNTRQVKALLLLQHCWALVSSKLQGAVCWMAQRIQQHQHGRVCRAQAASGVACVLPHLLLYLYNEQLIFWQTRHRKMSSFLPSPWFPAIQRMNEVEDRWDRNRDSFCTFKVSNKVLLEVWGFLPQQALSPAYHTHVSGCTWLSRR